MERAYMMLENVAIRLHKGQDLFYHLPETTECDRRCRSELIRALILALDLMERNGLSVERCPFQEVVRRSYTDGR